MTPFTNELRAALRDLLESSDEELRQAFINAEYDIYKDSAEMVLEDEKLADAIDKLSSKALLALEWVLRYRTSRMSFESKADHVEAVWGEGVLIELLNADLIQ